MQSPILSFTIVEFAGPVVQPKKLVFRLKLLLSNYSRLVIEPSGSIQFMRLMYSYFVPYSSAEVIMQCIFQSCTLYRRTTKDLTLFISISTCLGHWLIETYPFTCVCFCHLWSWKGRGQGVKPFPFAKKDD